MRLIQFLEVRLAIGAGVHAAKLHNSSNAKFVLGFSSNRGVFPRLSESLH
jgi:hypothetical protein